MLVNCSGVIITFIFKYNVSLVGTLRILKWLALIFIKMIMVT